MVLRISFQQRKWIARSAQPRCLVSSSGPAARVTLSDQISAQISLGELAPDSCYQLRALRAAEFLASVARLSQSADRTRHAAPERVRDRTNCSAFNGLRAQQRFGPEGRHRGPSPTNTQREIRVIVDMDGYVLELEFLPPHMVAPHRSADQVSSYPRKMHATCTPCVRTSCSSPTSQSCA
jgi:hypothetical protein